MFSYICSMKNIIPISFLFLAHLFFAQDSITNPSRPVVGVTIINPSNSYIDSSYAFSKKGMDKTSTEMEFLNILNEYRIFYGLSPVVLDPTLCKAAEIQAKYQATNQIVDHINSDKNLEFPHNRIESVGIYDYSRVREICVKVQKIVAFHRKRSIAQDALDRWVYSPSHNEAMLWKEAKKVGISFIESDKAKHHVYATVVFL